MSDSQSTLPHGFSLPPLYSFLFLLALSIIGLTILLIWGVREYVRPGGTDQHPSILYLNWDENEHNQLFFIDPEEKAPIQLTFQPLGVADFAVSPAGDQIIFSAWQDGGGSDLFSWRADNGGTISALLSCSGDLCSGPVFTPAGDLLVYERRVLSEPNALPETPRLWWLDPVTGDTLAIFEDAQKLGHSAGFSFDGIWLSYIDPEFQEVQVFNRETGQVVVISSQTGEPAAWHPLEYVMVTSEIQPEGESFSTHIFRVDISATESAAEVTNLSNERAVNDGTASFSPDGTLILFGRKVARAPMGRQLWIMQPDGSGQQRLTDEFAFHHGQPSWSPAGDQILMQRFHIEEPNADPGIWILDTESGELREVATTGIRPVWLPADSLLYRHLQ